MRRGFSDLVASLRDEGSRPALRTKRACWTYAELQDRALAHAATYQTRRCAPGSRVVAVAHPSLELVAAMLGAYWAGLVWVPLNPRARAPEVTAVLEDCRPDLVLTDARAAATAIPAHPGCAVLALEPTADCELWVPGSSSSYLAHEIDDDVPSLLIYTSGTTGRSKGVIHSHRTVATGIGALIDGWRWNRDDILSLMLPLFHVHGLGIGIHGALLAGAQVLLHAAFDTSAVVDDIANRGATVFMGVPTMYTRLLEHLGAHPEAANELARARLFTAGSAALSPHEFERFEALTGHRILERYGMSETLLTLSNPYEGERRAGAVGRPIEGVDARVVDDEGNDVSPGIPGELWIRAPFTMLGYWERPEANATAFASGGWFKTGDVVQADSDGYLRIVGRSSIDIIKSGGFKIGAREIEDVLRAHPDLLDVAILGIPDAVWGEIVAAVVIPAPGAAPRTEEAWLEALQDLASASLSDYKKPRAVRVVAELPRTPLGKPQKALLRPLFSGRSTALLP